MSEELKAYATTVENCELFRAELTAIKVPARDITAAVDAAMIEMANISPPMRRSECERLIRAALYATPVPEAKAQGVVMPDERSAFEKWGETLFFSACFERHGSDEYAGRGLQGAWLGWQARAALSGAPVQQASVPDGWKLVPVEPTLDMGWAYVDAANDASPGKRNSFNHFGYRAMLAAAPAPGGE